MSAAGEPKFWGPDQTPGQPSVALRLVTTGDFVGASHRATDLIDRMAWVLTFHHSKATYYGGYGSGPFPTVSPNCDFVIMIDATTSATISIFQTCPPAANS